jgi:hypothetical protein
VAFGHPEEIAEVVDSHTGIILNNLFNKGNNKCLI